MQRSTIFRTRLFDLFSALFFFVAGSLVTTALLHHSLGKQVETCAHLTEAATELREATQRHQNDAMGSENQLKKQLAAIEGQLHKLDTINSTLATLQEAPEVARQKYLDAARATQEDAVLTRHLYKAALAHSEHKMPILTELVQWTQQQMKKELQKETPDVQAAEVHLTQLLALCESALTSASAEDMLALSQLRAHVQEAEASLEAEREKLLAARHAELRALLEQEPESDNYEHISSRLLLLEQQEVPADLSERHRLRVAQLRARRACLTPDHQPLLIPTMDEHTPWLPWLHHLNARLQSDAIEPQRKLEELASAADFLQQARQQQNDELNSALAEIATSARALQLTSWEKRAEAVLASPSRNKTAIPPLLAESADFSNEELNLQRDRLLSLHKQSVASALSDLQKQAQNLRDVEEKNPPPALLMQMATIVQGQYMTTTLHVLELNATYEGCFEEELATLLRLSAEWESLASAKRDEAYTRKALLNAKAQRERFARIALERIEDAKTHFYDAKRVAKKGADDWTRAEAVRHCRTAWLTLMSIHPGDLMAVDPKLADLHQHWKKRIEEHWKPTEEELKSSGYLRLDDIRAEAQNAPQPTTAQ